MPNAKLSASLLLHIIIGMRSSLQDMLRIYLCDGISIESPADRTMLTNSVYTFQSFVIWMLVCGYSYIRILSVAKISLVSNI